MSRKRGKRTYELLKERSGVRPTEASNAAFGNLTRARMLSQTRFLAFSPHPLSARFPARFCHSANGSRGRLLPGFDALGFLRSLRARSGLDGVSWVQGGLVESAVGRSLAACNRIGAVVCPSLGRRSLRELDSASCLLDCQAFRRVGTRSTLIRMSGRSRKRE
jgi:hypothetical protein